MPIEPRTFLAYCKVCGSKIDMRYDRKFCRICGTRIDHRTLVSSKPLPPFAVRLIRFFEASETRIKHQTWESSESLPQFVAHAMKFCRACGARIKHLAWKGSRSLPLLVACTLIGLGVIVLVPSILSASYVLMLLGLGLLFWGVLFLFIRPRKYVRSELVNSTAFSLVKAIDRVLVDLGYSEKGIYIPTGKPEKIVAFIPYEPLTRVPKGDEIADGTFVKAPKGIVLVPPGLGVANMIEEELGTDLAECGLKTLCERLPKLLVENLEIVQDCDIELNGGQVNFTFVGSIYADFCSLCSDENPRVCSSLGCPLCSAMACVLAMTTRKAVSFEKNTFSADGPKIASSYRILEVESSAGAAEPVN